MAERGEEHHWPQQPAIAEASQTLGERQAPHHRHRCLHRRNQQVERMKTITTNWPSYGGWTIPIRPCKSKNSELRFHSMQTTLLYSKALVIFGFSWIVGSGHPQADPEQGLSHHILAEAAFVSRSYPPDDDDEACGGGAREAGRRLLWVLRFDCAWSFPSHAAAPVQVCLNKPHSRTSANNAKLLLYAHVNSLVPVLGSGLQT